jgi:hypothetical protein
LRFLDDAPSGTGSTTSVAALPHETYLSAADGENIGSPRWDRGWDANREVNEMTPPPMTNIEMREMLAQAVRNTLPAK